MVILFSARTWSTFSLTIQLFRLISDSQQVHRYMYSIGCCCRLFPCELIKIILCDVRSDWTKHQKTLKNSKFQFGRRDPLVTLFNQLFSCWPSWMAAITKNHKNGCCGSNVQDSDLQHKAKTVKFMSIFNFNMMSAILDRKIHKMATMGLLFKIKTWKKNKH